MNRVIAIGAACLVIGALGAGLFMVGGPNHARNEKYDRARLDDIGSIFRALSCSNPGPMPTELSKDEIERTCSRGLPEDALTDPKTKEIYAFKQVSDDVVEVCAIFSLPDYVMGLAPNRAFARSIRFDGKTGCSSKRITNQESS